MTAPPVGAHHQARKAISELFLDTQLDEADFQHLRDQLLASDLPLEELERIYFDEVAPILFWNTYAVAGVWSAFDQDWLEEEIRRRGPRRRVPVFTALRRHFVTRMTIADWQRLRALVAAAR